MPRFTIVIPCFNNAGTVGAAVESALAQRHDDFAVVVCDNASTDGSADIIRAYDSPRLTKLLSDVNLDKTSNWNRAYGAAPDCEYLVTLHGDDTLEPDCLQAIAACTDRKPSLIHGGAYNIDAKGARCGIHTHFPFRYTAGCSDFRKLLLLNNIVVVTGATMRTDAFHAIGCWPPAWTYMQDFEAWWLLAEHGPVVHTPHKLGSYRVDHLVRSMVPTMTENTRWYNQMMPKLAGTQFGAFARYGLARSLRELKGAMLEPPPEKARNAALPVIAEAEGLLQGSGLTGEEAIRRQRLWRLWIAARALFH